MKVNNWSYSIPLIKNNTVVVNQNKALN